jgi:predicted nucleic acid-binding protein
MDHIFFDTNIIIRFLTGGDLKKQAAAQAHTIYSYDRDFDRFSDITRQEPAEPSLEEGRAEQRVKSNRRCFIPFFLRHASNLVDSF